MGTLRKSIRPQQQFESLDSEPEKNFHAPPKRENQFNVSHQSEKMRKLNVASTRDKKSYTTVELSRRNKSRRSDKSNRGNFNDRTIEFLPSFRFLNEPNDLFVDSGVFSRGASTNQRERSTPVRDEAVQLSENFDFEDDDNNSRTESVDLERGNVCKKISVYEENVRLGSGRSEKILREALNASKRRRTIGVPLVGMHNACGLPVIAHWPENRVFGTLRVPGKSIGSLRRVGHRFGTSNRRNRNHTKRRAPQPSENQNSRKTHESYAGNDEVKISHNQENSGSTGRKRIFKKPSFKASKNAMPYRRRCCRKNSGKMGNSEARTETMTGNFDKKETMRRSVKRSTLYAKDDGNEAAEVLTNLCLNPLARKGAANMIW